MSLIKKLPLHEAQKIAAGEVVERPANIVKELIENSLDANATSITLLLQDGGKKNIQVIDNGSGMDRQDAIMCFEKHATSKITSVHDLDTLTTFGFRGEALASIAAVGKVSLSTKTSTMSEGIKIDIQEGQVLCEELVSCITGTTITVKDLFYTIPARKKFLKTKETEWRLIQDLFQAFSLNHLAVHFKLVNEGKTVYNCPAVSNLAERCTQLFSHTTAPHLIPIKNQDDHGNTITGIITDHQHTEYSRNRTFFFINNRWVKNFQLGSALMKAYHNVLQPGRYPLACIKISVDPHEVDINIHPRKEEIRFLHPRIIESLITSIAKQALEANLSQQLHAPVSFTPAQPMQDFAPEGKKSPKMFTQFDFNALFQSPELLAPLPSVVTVTPPVIHYQDVAPQTLNQQTTFSADADMSWEHRKLVGQLHATYILLEHTNGLYVIDQHAAHERILYEQFSSRFKDLPTITLLFPQIIKLAPQDITLLEPYLALFHDNGIAIEQFSHDQVIIQATPVHLKDIALTDIVQLVLGWITEFSHLEEGLFFKTIHEKLHAQMACKAAIKAGDILTHEHMEQLLKDLSKTPNRFTCPHGRPTGWLLSSYEIEKKFKRKT
jgi:DNA mismatch repair protein MutL